MRSVLGWIGGVIILVGLCGDLVGQVTYAPQAFQPSRGALPSEQVTSFTEDANLEGEYVFFVDFEPEGTAWFASSNGLYAYDGYTWARYTTEDGLPSNFVRCVLVAENGTLWVGTDNGVALRDGETFTLFEKSDELAGPNVRRIRQDPDGSIWVMSDKWLQPSVASGLSHVRNGTVVTYGVEDGLPSAYVSDYFRDSSGRQFVATLRGLAQKAGDRWVEPLQEQGFSGADSYVWSIVESPVHGLVASTSEAYYVLHNDTWERVPNRDPEHDLPKLISTQSGTIYTVKNRGDLQLWEWGGADFIPTGIRIASTGSGEYLSEAPDGNLWIVGTGLVVRVALESPSWVVYEGLPPLANVTSQGDVWFIGADRAVVRRAGDWLAFPTVGGVAVQASGQFMWLRQQEGVARLSPSEAVVLPARRFASDSVLDMAVDSRGVPWVAGTDTSGALTITAFRDFPAEFAMESLAIEGRITSVFADTTGFYFVVIESPLQPFLVGHATLTGEGVSVSFIDGPITTSFSSPGIYRTGDGELWIYGDFGLQRFSETGWLPETGIPGRNVFAALRTGRATWFAYSSIAGGRSGLSKYEAGSWYHAETPVIAYMGSSPLDESIVKSPGGYYVVAPQTERTPQRLSMPKGFRARWLLRDLQRSLWASDGVRTIHQVAPPTSPRTDVEGLVRTIFPDMPLTVRVEGHLPFKAESDENLQYAWRLNDGPWTPYGQAPSTISTDALDRIGTHTLDVRARSERFVPEDQYARLVFRVVPTPVQQRPWFWPALVLGLLLILGLSTVTWLSKQRVAELAEGLEDEVAQRTQALRISEARLIEAQQIAQLGYWELDIPRNVLSWSIAVYEIFEISPDELTPSYEGFLRFVHPEDIARLKDAQASALAGEEPLDIKHRIITGKDQVKYVRERGQLHRDETGTAVRLMGTVQDVTKQHLSEQELVRRNRELSVLLTHSQEVGTRYSFREVLHILLRCCRSLFPYMDAAMLWMVVERNKETFVLSTTSTVQEVLDRSTPVLRLFDQHKEVQVLPLSAVSMGADSALELDAAAYEHGAFYPVFAEGSSTVRGVIGLLSHQPSAFCDEDERALIDSLVAQASLAIQRVQYVSDLKAVSQRLLDAQEQERKYLAQELHDEVGALLTSLQLLLGIAIQQLGAKEDVDTAIIENLEEASTVVSDLSRQTRDLSLRLRPGSLDDLGLKAAVEWFIEQYAAKTQIDVTLSYEAEVDQRFSSVVETSAYRIVQEALTNIARHANVDHAVVSISSEDDQLRLSIEDEGEGFDAHELGTRNSMGLSGMRERTELAGGAFTVHTRAGKGTRIVAEIPLN